jgi:hypothetical protein
MFKMNYRSIVHASDLFLQHRGQFTFVIGTLAACSAGTGMRTGPSLTSNQGVAEREARIKERLWHIGLESRSAPGGLRFPRA